MIWVRNTSCSWSNYFICNSQAESCCNSWCEHDLLKTVAREKQLDNSSVNRESNTDNFVVDDLGSSAPSIRLQSKAVDFVAVVYDRKPYARKVHDLDEDEAYIYFLSNNGILHRQSKFKVPRVQDNVWVSLNDILCIILEPISTKKAFEICAEAVENVIKKCDDWLQRFWVQ